jgi:hypothetical protein
MYITCTLHVHYMYITCTLHVHYMYITCTLHVHYMLYITCTLHVHYMYITCTLHVHYMYITCTLHVHYMYITCMKLLNIKNDNNITLFFHITIMCIRMYDMCISAIAPRTSNGLSLHVVCVCRTGPFHLNNLGVSSSLGCYVMSHVHWKWTMGQFFPSLRYFKVLCI